MSLLQKSPVKERYSAKETYNLIDPTDRSHPIYILYIHHLNSEFRINLVLENESVYTLVCHRVVWEGEQRRKGGCMVVRMFMVQQKSCTQTLSDLYMKIKMYGQQIMITIPQQIPNFGPHRQYVHTFHRHTYSMMYTSSLIYIYRQQRTCSYAFNRYLTQFDPLADVSQGHTHSLMYT